MFINQEQLRQLQHLNREGVILAIAASITAFQWYCGHILSACQTTQRF